MTINIAKLNKELSTLRIEKQEVATQLASQMEKAKNWEEEKSKLLKRIEELEKKLEESKKEEAAVVVAVEESVNKKVVQNLASLGVPQGTIKEDVVQTAMVVESPTEIYKKYETLAGKEKIEFFNKNERAILTGMKMVHFTNNPLVKDSISARNSRF